MNFPFIILLLLLNQILQLLGSSMLRASPRSHTLTVKTPLLDHIHSHQESKYGIIYNSINVGTRASSPSHQPHHSKYHIYDPGSMTLAAHGSDRYPSAYRPYPYPSHGSDRYPSAYRPYPYPSPSTRLVQEPPTTPSFPDHNLHYKSINEPTSIDRAATVSRDRFSVFAYRNLTNNNSDISIESSYLPTNAHANAIISLQAQQSDANALCAFKQGITNWPAGSLSISGWTCTGSTATSLPCSITWTGVTCSNGVITILELNSKELAGTISPAISLLTGLNSLQLGINRLTD